LDKTGRIEASEESQKGSEAMDIGKMVENGILDWAANELSLKVIKNQYRVHKDGILSATHDAIADHLPEGLEAKTAGLMGPLRDSWGEAGTDEVPDHVLIQCMHQMIVSDLDVVYVPALLGGRGRVLYRVNRDEDLCRSMLDKLTAFWENYVVSNVPPRDLMPSMDVAKKIRREPNSKVSLGEDLVQAWLAAKEEKKRAEENEESAKLALIAALGEAESGECETGFVTYLEQSKRSVDMKGLREAYGGMVSQYESKTKYRVLRWKEAKKDE